MRRTRLSLWYVVGYLFPVGLGLVFAPQVILKIFFSNQQYGDAFPRFTGLLMVTMASVIVTSRDPFFIVVLVTVGLGMVATGSLYLAERKRWNFR